ncbi:MAG: Mur ligase domain-containing protein [bacterium]
MNIYLIGICGITMGSIAIELKKLGHNVIGSDKGIYDPMSTMLKNAQIEVLIGFKEEHISNLKEKLDMVVVGNAISLDNLEYLKCKQMEVEILSYPEVLKKFCIKKNSIVVAGTYGKTTITALLVHIFNNLKVNPSYMIGGKALNLDQMVSFNDSSWSIAEGDEYFTSKTIAKSKFFFYSTKYLILTSAEWDHTDIFKTEEEYINNFVELIKSIPEDGIIVANKNGKNVVDVILRSGKQNITQYYDYTDVSLSKYSPKIIGKHNYENILSVVTLLLTLKEKSLFLQELSTNDFNKILSDSINSYLGIYRRLNILLDNEKLVVVDDFAHSPSKFKATIDCLKEKYKGCDITAVVEPNMGNRTKLSLTTYKEVFKDVTRVIIPKWRINKLKLDSELASSEDFKKMLLEEKVNVEIQLDDNLLLQNLEYVVKNA